MNLTAAKILRMGLEEAIATCWYAVISLEQKGRLKSEFTDTHCAFLHTPLQYWFHFIRDFQELQDQRRIRAEIITKLQQLQQHQQHITGG